MEEVKNVKISELQDFRNHPFRVEEDRGLCELMQSIGEEGVIVPLLVRPAQDGKDDDSVLQANQQIVEDIIRRMKECAKLLWRL